MPSIPPWEDEGAPPAPTPASTPTRFKRICIFSDGSWNDPEAPVPTNIVELAKGVKLRASDNIPQLVFYDAGVGTADSYIDYVRGGALGVGIDVNIQELYTFLAMNYEQGDEIYLFGFSRGAYTVRSLAGFIFEAGLVRRRYLDYVKEAYDLYRSPIEPESDKAKAFRKSYGGRVPIKLLCCFDTVGALGLPPDRIIWPFSWIYNTDQFAFHNTTISPMIENAIHPMSIDEDRKGFLPTPMTPCQERGPKQVTEKFLAGYHSGVGGGGKFEKPFSDCALHFVLDDMAKRGLGLEFDMDRMPGHGNVESDLGALPWSYVILRFLAGKCGRTIESVDRLHESAIHRFCTVPTWRPRSLKALEKEILEKGRGKQ